MCGKETSQETLDPGRHLAFDSSSAVGGCCSPDVLSVRAACIVLSLPSVSGLLARVQRTENSVIVPLTCPLFANWKLLLYVSWNGCGKPRDAPSNVISQDSGKESLPQPNARPIEMTPLVSTSLCRSLVPSRPKGLVVCVTPRERSFVMLTKHAADGRNMLPSFGGE